MQARVSIAVHCSCKAGHKLGGCAWAKSMRWELDMAAWVLGPVDFMNYSMPTGERYDDEDELFATWMRH